MSDIPAILPDEPITTAAIPAKTYPKLWMTRLVVDATHPLNKTVISFELCPYDGINTILNNPKMTNAIPDAFDLAAKDPQFGQVLGGVLLMVEKYKNIDFSRPFTIDPETYAVTQEETE